jgi:RNA polymerase II subunit A-like phosphatase
MKGSHELILTDLGRCDKLFIKLRPKLKYFLDELHPLYHMSIYTHGTRKYAEGTCKIMDPEGLYFGKRIVSRSDHPELGSNKSLAQLLKTDWSKVLIYDDREDVWRKGGQRDHLLCAKPFIHFDKKSLGGEKEAAVVNNAPGMISLGGDMPTHELTSDTGVDESNIITRESDANKDSSRDSSPDDDDDDDDEDEGLVRAVAVFKKLHSLYFAPNSSSPYTTSSVLPVNEFRDASPLSIGTILRDVRRQILLGCVICFSGVIPKTHRKPQYHPLWVTARKLGATVESDLTDDTTHLLTLGLGANKTTNCLNRKDVFVLHCDWLLHCHWNVKHEDETTFFLVADHSPGEASMKVLHRAEEQSE